MYSTRRALTVLAVIAAFTFAAIAPAQQTDADAAKAQVLNIYKIFKARDWKSLYDVIGFSSANAATMGTREEFADGFAKGLTGSDPDDAFGKLIDGMKDVAVGGVIIEGDSAYVPTSCTITVSGTAVKLMGLAKMKKLSGTWKWDLTYIDDAEKAAAERTAQLFGEAPQNLG